MKTTVNRNEFFKALCKVDKFFSPYPSFYKSAYLKLECTNTGLSIIGSYKNNFIKYHISCDCEELGYSIINFDKLDRVLNRIKKYKIRKLALYDKGVRFCINYGKSEIKLLKKVVYEKKAFDYVDDSKYSFILPKNFEKIIKKVSIAVGYAPKKYALTGIYFEINSDGMCVTATNGHIISHIETKDVSLPNGSINFILPTFTLCQALNFKCDKLEMSDNKAYFTNTLDNTLIGSPYIDGPYPNYRIAIPKNQSNRAVINKNTFITSTDSFLLFTTGKINYLFDNIMIMEGKNYYADTEFTETLPIKYHGKPMQISFNGYDIKNTLNVINNKSFVWYLSTPYEATIIRPASTVFVEEYYLLIPLRIDAKQRDVKLSRLGML